MWIIDASLSVTAPFPFFRHSSRSAIFRSCWQLWGFKVLNIVFVLAFLIKGYATFWSTKYDSFSPIGSSSLKFSVRFFFCLLSHLWITAALSGSWNRDRTWIIHAITAARACVSGAVSRHVQPLVHVQPFVLTTITMKRRRWLNFTDCLMTCVILTQALVLVHAAAFLCWSVKYSHVAQRVAVLCVGAKVHAVTDGEPGSVVQPQSPEAHNEQNQRARGELRASNIDAPAKKV